MNKQREYWDKLAGHPLDASVIDPNDRFGAKNLYLAGIRNREVLRRLSDVKPPSVVLDLGCGTGSLSHALSAEGHSVIGMDIAHGLLKRTVERRFPAPTAFARYDGLALPIRDECIDAAVTYVVLTHVISDADLSMLLAECYRVLKPGASMVCIEQVRSQDQIDTDGWKHFRTKEHWSKAICHAGFRIKSCLTIRLGRFPITHLLRARLWPRAWFGVASTIERALARVLPILPGDYSDVVFVLEKARQ